MCRFDYTGAYRYVHLIRSLVKPGGAADKLDTGTVRLRRALSGDEPKCGAFIAEINGQAAGLASCAVSYSIWTDECYISIDTVFVQPDYRGSGAGHQLLKQ